VIIGECVRGTEFIQEIVSRNEEEGVAVVDAWIYPKN
jgi:hypothetical protein